MLKILFIFWDSQEKTIANGVAANKIPLFPFNFNRMQYNHDDFLAALYSLIETTRFGD